MVSLAVLATIITVFASMGVWAGVAMKARRDKGSPLQLFAVGSDHRLYMQRTQLEADGTATVKAWKRTYKIGEDAVLQFPTKPALLGLTRGTLPAAIVHKDAGVPVLFEADEVGSDDPATDAAGGVGAGIDAGDAAVVGLADGDARMKTSVEWDTSHNLYEFKRQRLVEALIAAAEKDAANEMQKWLVFGALGFAAFCVLVIVFILYQVGILSGEILQTGR